MILNSEKYKTVKSKNTKSKKQVQSISTVKLIFLYLFMYGIYSIVLSILRIFIDNLIDYFFKTNFNSPSIYLAVFLLYVAVYTKEIIMRPIFENIFDNYL